MVGSVRSGVGALRTALNGRGTTLVVTSDIRIGLPTSADESSGGDGAAAVVVGDDDVIAEFLGAATVTDEFVDRWRTPGDARSQLWEERFGEQMYVPAAEEALDAALKAAELSADQVDVLVACGLHGRAVGRFAAKTRHRPSPTTSRRRWATPVPPIRRWCWPRCSTRPSPVRSSRSSMLSDGAEVLLLRTTDAIAAYRPGSPHRIARSIERFGRLRQVPDLAGLLTRRAASPPRARPTVGVGRRSRRRLEVRLRRLQGPGVGHHPPAAPRVGIGDGDPRRVDDMEPVPMADVLGTVVTFTVDRLAYSLSPPVVFAVVDFDGGGRMPIELTDCRARRCGSATGSR